MNSLNNCFEKSDQEISFMITNQELRPRSYGLFGSTMGSFMALFLQKSGARNYMKETECKIAN